MPGRARGRTSSEGLQRPPGVRGFGISHLGCVAMAQLVRQLERICGDDHVVTHPHALRTYESDGLLQYHVTPRIAVLPGTADEVREVVVACHGAGVPWVARGGGAGLSGGALPVEEGGLLVLTRLHRLLEVDLATQRVVVEPGVTNVAVSHAI